MPKLTDLLNEADRKKAEAWKDKALKPEYDTEIPPEIYQVAMHGVYFGFSAIEAIFRGYIDAVDQRTGKPIRIPYDLETVIALNKAARKVTYRQIVDECDIQAIASLSAQDKKWANITLKRTNEMRKGKF